MDLPGFVAECEIGTGASAHVYKARRQNDGKTYAVKVIETKNLNHEDLRDALNEIRLMASFESPFIETFYEAKVVGTKIYLVTEFAQFGDLDSLISKRKETKKKFLEEDIWRCLIQIIQGLHVIHEAGVIHRDLKSANILICAPDLVKIGDLGISTVVKTKGLATTQLGTPYYIAPEIWKKMPYDEKCDIWSLGVLAYEMMTFNYPFTGADNKAIKNKACYGMMNPIKQGCYSDELVEFIRTLLQIDPADRPNTLQLLNSQSIRLRTDSVNSMLVDEATYESSLIGTIEPSQKLQNIKLPPPNYSHKEMIKPLNQRMQKSESSRNAYELAATREMNENEVKHKNVKAPSFRQNPLSHRGNKGDKMQMKRFAVIDTRLKRALF